MKAGRELDALIAEHFYGWRRETIGGDYDGKHGGTKVLVPPTILDVAPHLPRRGEVHLAYFAPSYSKDDLHALRLIEDMQARGLWVSINTTCDKGLYDIQVMPDITNPESCFALIFQPFALGICRAALKASGYQPSSEESEGEGN